MVGIRIRASVRVTPEKVRTVHVETDQQDSRGSLALSDLKPEHTGINRSREAIDPNSLSARHVVHGVLVAGSFLGLRMQPPPFAVRRRDESCVRRKLVGVADGPKLQADRSDRAGLLSRCGWAWRKQRPC